MLIFVHNNIAKNKENVEKFIKMEEKCGVALLYRVHRYHYIAEKDAREEEVEVSEGVKSISEWYTLIIMQFLKLEDPVEAF